MFKSWYLPNLDSTECHMAIRNGCTYPKVITVIFKDTYNHGSQMSKHLVSTCNCGSEKCEKQFWCICNSQIRRTKQITFIQLPVLSQLFHENRLFLEDVWKYIYILNFEKRRRCYWRNEIIDQPTLLKSQWYAYLSLSFLYTLLDSVFLYSSSTSFNGFFSRKNYEFSNKNIEDFFPSVNLTNFANL
jgi:hypothetical protein